jgi:tetratricopeptide (TPR) repeat protein
VASVAYLPLGALRAAEANLRRRIALCREIKDEFHEAIGHQDLGRLLAYRGVWEESIQVHERGISFARKRQNQQIECVIAAYSAQRALFMGSIDSALEEAQKARRLADIPFPGIGKLPRDLVRADWVLGAAHRASGDTGEADRRLSEALTRCRSINAVEHEADVLLDLARLRAAMAPPCACGASPPASGGDRRGGREEALRLAQEALVITERCGYVLQGADVYLFLAQMALEDGDEETALEHTREARRLATCDGPPDYTYKVAYDEAGALLQRIESG